MLISLLRSVLLPQRVNTLKTLKVFSPVLCWLRSARITVVICVGWFAPTIRLVCYVLGVVCCRCLVRNCCSRILFPLCHDISTGCAKNVLACHYAPSRATAACCQSAYSQQALHVFFTI